MLVLNDPPDGHNAHLSDRVKTQMYLQHRKDPKTWDAPALAVHFQAGSPPPPQPWRLPLNVPALTRGLHSFTFRLNVSALCRTGGCM